MKENFLRLVRLGIGHSAEPLRGSVDWDDVEALAAKQGLLGVVLNGIQRVADFADGADYADGAETIPYKKRLEWLGKVMLEEKRYVEYRKAISELAAFYNSHGCKMMVLKGYACSLNWPKSEHRPCGDIDIWLFGKQKEADAVLENLNLNEDKTNQFTIDRSHHHHTVFNWMGFTVENHYDFVNVHALRASAEMEKVFKELGSEANLNHNENENSFGTRIPSVEVGGEKVYFPSANMHALFLLKHCISHFVGANINLRQVLDWAFFVEKHTEEIDWKWLYEMIEKFHMKNFLNCINAICVENLGFSPTIFPAVQFLPSMKEKVLNDILEPEYTAAEPKGLMKRMVYKYRRWQGNAWKQRLCYGESRWSAFWTGVWAKILKPASI